MPIGDKIKEHRIKNNLTQRELADMLGVSVQAVSKWERGNGTPDPVHITTLAKSLHITIDELFDYRDRLKELNDLWHDVERKHKPGSAELIEFDEKALKEFPNDKTFLFRLMMDVYIAAKDMEDPQEKTRSLERSLFIGRRMLDNGDDNHGTVTSHMVRVLSDLGRKNEALARVYNNSTLTYEEQSKLLKYCLEGEELLKLRQWIVRNTFSSLISEMTWDINALEAAERLFKALLPDGNYTGFHYDLKDICLKKTAIYLNDDRIDDAITEIRKCIQFFHQISDDFRKGEHVYTSPILSKLSGKVSGYNPALFWIDEFIQLFKNRTEDEAIDIIRELNELKNEISSSCNP